MVLYLNFVFVIILNNDTVCSYVRNILCIIASQV